MEESKKFLLQAIFARADGYMLTKNTYSDLVIAIEKVRQGGSYFCNIISGKMADIIREEINSKEKMSLNKVRRPLSAKEIKVLTLRCQSKSCKEIAELLSLSPSTIKNHIDNIKNKLNCRTQVELIKYAIKEGYIL
jgi:two-component system response regulator DegU